MTPTKDESEPAWMRQGVCRREKIPTAVFFSTPSDAVVYCQRCEVATECADFARVNGERFGVWGGKYRDRSTSTDIEELARRVVRRRLPENSEARKALRKLSRAELHVLAILEGLK